MSTLPAFAKDVSGQCYGGAFWDSADYRVRIKEVQHVYHLTVENSSGHRVGEMVIDDGIADGIARMASTDHGLSGYEDDWTIPPGMERVLTWVLPMNDETHSVVLNEAVIDEIAAWLEYATGEETYDGDPENWEY